MVFTKAVPWLQLCLICIHASVVSKRWAVKVKGIDDVGTLLLCKLHIWLFQRSTRNAREVLQHKMNLLTMLFFWHV